mmetsp:Transcript_28562/g.75037  ORF Transcript_28562/g.75037 Transcript_28562/m.75037 type:complete len:264 (+) Transcript_28562:334-1125(+)
MRQSGARRGAATIQVLTRARVHATCPRSPCPRQPRDAVLRGNRQEGLVVPHHSTIKGGRAALAGPVGGAACLAKLGNDDWFVGRVENAEDVLLESVGAFIHGAGLRRAHIRVKVVNHVAIASGLELGVELDERHRVVGVPSRPRDDGWVGGVLPHGREHLEHPSRFSISIHPLIHRCVRFVVQLVEHQWVVTKRACHRVPESDTVGGCLARHRLLFAVVVGPVEIGNGNNASVRVRLDELSDEGLVLRTEAWVLGHIPRRGLC